MVVVAQDSASVAVRGLPVAFLLTLVAARCADGFGSGDYGYLPFVVAVFALPLWYASGLARRPWHTFPWALLAVQAVLTYVPFVALGD
ncbi:hypothetical protein ALI144C_35995 [Actinosynnema sp. ALI-1.44]|uniref:hypothetical protein n=1 Tax=Actinosynnema sp. ALI-1.44 TaxID=1933779 RepID=UPI00097C99A4|nr:hypothetical protein [Actinosynnema sp. ALI-1.44]ONI76102.1 hypothetical protein ALI144C_35995 [Actinosynnema sp. ALI-1.44]